MKLKHQDPVVEKKNPFLNCKLERKQYADVLTNIVEHYADGFVMAINNEWGTGKTVFVRMWKQHLENKGFKTLYYNAWENDFEEDVLVALISELHELKESSTEDAFKTLLDKAAPLSKKLLTGVGKAIAKKFAGEEGEDIAKALIESTIEVGASELEAEIKDYTKRKKGIDDFKSSLERFVKELDGEKPVIFIVDELDRCRPDYSVKVLEQIKHLFSVLGIVYVLSIDKAQLANAIRGFYGSEKIAAEEYLRRFIDLEYSLPILDTKLFTEYLYDYFQFDNYLLNSDRPQRTEYYGERDEFISFASFLFKKVNATLRHQEKIFGLTRLVINLLNIKRRAYPSLILLLIYFKQFHQNIYLKLLNNSTPPNELVRNIEDIFDMIQEEEGLRLFLYAEALLVKFYINSFKAKHDIVNFFKKNEETGEDLLIIESKDNFISNNDTFNDFLNFLDRNISDRNIKLDYYLRKIDLMDPLSF